MIFGMRLHSLILATFELTPVVGAAYQPKVQHYLRTLDLQDYCVGFEQFDSASVAAAVVNGWHDRVRQHQMLAERIPVLRERTSIAAKLVAAVNHGEDIGQSASNVGTYYLPVAELWMHPQQLPDDNCQAESCIPLKKR